MLRFSALAPLACTALCSCLSQNYRAVMAWGEWQEATLFTPEYERELHGAPEKNDSRVTFMRVGSEYYAPCVKTRCKTDYKLPHVCLTFLGGAGTTKELITGANVQHGWRKAKVHPCAGGGMQYDHEDQLEDTPFLTQLPQGATPVTVNSGYNIFSGLDSATLGPTQTDWHALYAYPLAAVTAVCIDLPTMVVGNVCLGTILGGVSLLHWEQSTPDAPPPADPAH